MLKPFFITLVILSFFKIASAQKKDTSLYYLKGVGRLTYSKDDADYFLLIQPPDTLFDKNLNKVTEYYTDGNIRLIGGTLKDSLTIRLYNSYDLFLSGTCTYFFRDGKKMKVCNYEDGIEVGDETLYYPNGKLYCKRTILKDKSILYKECRDSTGKVLTENGNGKWLEFKNDEFKNRYREGEIKDNCTEGIWQVKSNDSLKSIYTYEHNKLISAANVDSLGKLTYFLTELPAEFNGGFEEFSRYIKKNLKSPRGAQYISTPGRVILSFIIEKDGSITEVEIQRGFGNGYDEEAKRVITECPKWKPGYHNGLPVRIAYSIPIGFNQ